MQRIIAAILVATSLGSSAGAATLVTGALVAQAHRCCALNVTAKPIDDIALRLLDENGNDVTGTDLCQRNLPLEPGGTCCAQSFAADSGVHCVLTFDAGKSAVRGTLAAEEGIGRPVAAIEAR